MNCEKRIACGALVCSIQGRDFNICRALDCRLGLVPCKVPSLQHLAWAHGLIRRYDFKITCIRQGSAEI